MEISQFALEHVFNKYVTQEGEVIYWRDCVLRSDMVNGEQGYVWVFANGDSHHSYRTPEQCFGPSKE